MIIHQNKNGSNTVSIIKLGFVKNGATITGNGKANPGSPPLAAAPMPNINA